MRGHAAHPPVRRLSSHRDARHLRARRLIALPAAALAVLLAACGPLPRPFEPERKGDNDLLLLPDRHGIAVTTPTGDVPREADALAKAMAEALQKRNVPASVASANARARWLMVHAERTAADGAIRKLRLTWELYGPDGEPIGEHVQTARVRARAWIAGEPAALARVARAAAGPVAAMIQDPPVRESALPGYPPDTRIVVAPLTGGPGDAARALARAMARHLGTRGLPLADRAEAGDIVVTGRLDVAPGAAGGRSVRVTWIIRRAGRADGRLGDLRQANNVSRAEIEAGWDRLSDLIARAAVPGVIEVLETGAARR